MAVQRQSRTEDTPVRLTRENVDALTRGLPRRARTVLKLITNVVHGSLVLTTPEGDRFLISGSKPGPNAELHLRNWSLPARAAAGGSIGAAESYLDEDWESPDVTTFLEFFLVNSIEGVNLTRGSNWLLSLVQKFQHWMNDNTKRGSKRNISAHYDLGNRFYSQWLDETMTYSSALFADGANDLTSAQRAKYRALCEGMGLKSGQSVLEIGCGWGGFAEVAASEFGAKVTGLTISREQFDFATARMKRAGLSDRVEIKFQDYRDETGRYDQIASIEMFEAVGERHWPTYFAKVRECLKAGGTAGLQIICMNNRDFPVYRRQPDFIQRYIFPGGMLPSPNALEAVTGENDLKLVSERVFAQDYARTLALWRERFLKAWPEIVPLGFDERFKRLWLFYLHYCEAGFGREFIDVRQMFYR